VIKLRRRYSVLVTTLILVALAIYARVYPSPILAGTFSSSSTSSDASLEGGQWYRVSRVVDGDTLVLLIQNKKTTVRLIGLDTPEVVDPRKPVQCFGREASAYMKQLTLGKQVHIEKDPSQGDYDKYNRLLVYVFLPDGTNVSEHMIREGYGHEYTYRFPYKYQVAFKRAQIEAREAQRGLWAPGVCAAN
jgi:micrococcal nuclease